MTALDALRARRAELARRIDVLDRVTGFVDALSAELGIAAEIEFADGDLIVVIPQLLDREPAAVVTPERPARDIALAPHSVDGIAVDPFCDDCGERHEGACEDDSSEPVTEQAPLRDEPPAPEPKQTIPAAARNGLPWDPHEDDRLLALSAQGMTGAQIAAALGRAVAATYARRAVLQKRRAAETCATAHGSNARQTTPAPAAPHVSEPAKTEHVARLVSAPVTRPLPESEGTPGWLHELRAHLNALGHAAPWTPALDRRLAEGLAAGRKLADLAPVLGVTVEQAMARWRALLPEPGIEAQARLLAELRERAAMREAAE